MLTDLCAVQAWELVMGVGGNRSEEGGGQGKNVQNEGCSTVLCTCFRNMGEESLRELIQVFLIIVFLCNHIYQIICHSRIFK